MSLKTTTIGAFPKPGYVTLPDWFDNPDKADPTAGWAEAMAAMGDDADGIVARGIKDAVAAQVDAGVDIPTDGEIRRENYIHYHCRHLSGIDFELSVAIYGRANRFSCATLKLHKPQQTGRLR